MNNEFINNTLQKVYVLEHQLAIERMKTKQVGESLKQVIDMTRIPKERFRWYKLLGGKTMVKTSKRSRRSKRSGSRNDSTPITSWGPEVTPGLPGAIGLPPIRPTLMRSPAERSPVRQLDFSSEPGCVPISKRLPGHRKDQCEKSDSADGQDRAICKQPGSPDVDTLDDCGPVRVGVRGGKKNKTKKSTRRRIHSRRR
jgi:hypothetical protein